MPAGFGPGILHRPPAIDIRAGREIFMSKKSKQYDDDDGRRIADMSGMDDSLYGSGLFGRSPRRRKDTDTDDPDQPKSQEPPLNRRETLSLIINAMGAGLIIGAIFIGAAFLFILFCVKVWFN